mgnify:CR=1 FL=1
MGVVGVGLLVPVGDPKHLTIVSIDGTPLGCKAVRDRLIDLEIATPLPEMAKRAVAAAKTAAEQHSLPINLRAAREVADRKAIRQAMSRSDNNISSAAKLLGISRPTLYDLIKQYRLQA